MFETIKDDIMKNARTLVVGSEFDISDSEMLIRNVSGIAVRAIESIARLHGARAEYLDDYGVVRIDSYSA